MLSGISVDTNIIVYSLNKDSDEHERARGFLEKLTERADVVIAEQTLVELYLLIRNPVVFEQPFDARGATEVCERFRTHPRWRLVECRPVMLDVWKFTSQNDFPRRRIIDTRLALTLISAGVTDFATRNIKDFEGFGFSRVFNPVDE